MEQELQNQFGRDPSLFPHMLDIPTEQVMLSTFDEKAYHAASFLDRRAITPDLKRQIVPFQMLESIQLENITPANYIFHIGHVGSTLISRLLGELPEVFALREPQILRDLSELSQTKDLPHAPWAPETYRDRRELIKSWLSRTYRPNQKALIKASSFVSDLAPELIEKETKNLFLYVPLEVYLQTILAGDGSRQEAEQLASNRLMRLNARLEKPLENLWNLSHAQKVALGWMCEMSSMMNTYEDAKQTTIRWQNFNDFLENPREQISELARFFEASLDDKTAENLVTSKIMNSYSKAPEHDYSPELRRQLLQQANANFKEDISATLNWVSSKSNSHFLIEKIVNFAGIAV